MTTSKPKDPWRIPTFLLWLVFMFIGLVPDAVFHLLQASAGVIRYEALIGSPLVLTVAFAGYLAAFAYSESVRGGCPQHLSLGNAIQIGAIALVAFVPVTIEALQFAAAMRYANLLFVSMVILTTAGVKLIAWCYLMSFLFRYYLLERQEVFAQMASFFPSARQFNAPDEESPPGERSTIPERDSFEGHGNTRRFSE